MNILKIEYKAPAYPGCTEMCDSVNSVMHIQNSNIKLFNAYNATNKFLNFSQEISQIVENMDYLYV
jgi:hypothetical protein